MRDEGIEPGVLDDLTVLGQDAWNLRHLKTRNRQTCLRSLVKCEVQQKRQPMMFARSDKLRPHRVLRRPQRNHLYLSVVWRRKCAGQIEIAPIVLGRGEERGGGHIGIERYGQDKRDGWMSALLVREPDVNRVVFQFILQSDGYRLGPERPGGLDSVGPLGNDRRQAAAPFTADYRRWVGWHEVPGDAFRPPPTPIPRQLGNPVPGSTPRRSHGASK